MNIKCPNCQTAYVIPDEKVGGKPKKMRCSRCQEVFTVKRRSQKTPIGYQEFTGKQNALPQEFAFLRASNLPDPPIEAPGVEASVAEASKPAAAPPPVPPKKAPAAPTSTFEDFTQPPDFDEMKTSPGVAPGPKVERRESAAAPSPSPSPETRTRPASGPRPAAPTRDLFGGNTWETEAPLDLGHYAVPSAESQRIGKIVAIICGVVLLFFGFVMMRNGWSMSLSSLPDQIAFAFSGGEYEELPAAVEDLEVTVNERRLLNRVGSGALVIVVGNVFNNSPVERKSVLLRGKLMDANGDIKGEVRVPCDKIFEDSALKKTRTGQIPTLYRKNGEVADCTIRGESSTVFQMVFENVPPDYDQSYTLEVKPVFAK